MTYLQAIAIALVQGVTELFPVSSLGHSVLVPAWFGGSWQTLVTQSAQSNSESSFYLAYIVALHVATALALLWFFRADWIRIIAGFFRSLRRSVGERRFTALGSDERLAWLIVLATIPVGLTGLLLEHAFRTVFAKPVAASVFLFINGLILLAGERFRRRGDAVETQPSSHGRARMPIAGASPDADKDADRPVPHPRGRGRVRSRSSARRTSPTYASRRSGTATASSSARCRSSRCWRESAARE
jgi:undecaprenyl-diphosphatase